jgi:hypothetical protein
MEKVRVTRKHIKFGMPEAAANCPIALAVRDYMKGYKGGTVYVDHEVIEIGPHSFLCSRKVKRFVEAFDAGRPVKPFTFVLRST